MRTNGLALASLVLGVVGSALALIPLAGPYVCWLPALFAIIFGVIGLREKYNGLNREAARWGVILGFAPIVIATVVGVIAIGLGL